MTHDNNKERDERIRKVPAPVLKRDPVIVQNEFEDLGLHTSLKVLAVSRHDADEFLQKVNSKIQHVAESTVGQAESKRTFFGLAESLLKSEKPNLEAVTKTLASKPVETDRREKPRYSVVIATLTAAALLIGFVVWHVAFRQDDKSLLIAGNTVEEQPNQNEFNKPALAIRTTKIAQRNAETSVAEHTPKTIEEIPTPPVVAISTIPVAGTATVNIFCDLRFEFDESLEASAWIGRRKIKDEIPYENTNRAIKGLCHAIAKQVHFYSPILESKWQGKLSIIGPEFHFEQPFDGIDEMCDAGFLLRQSFQEFVDKTDRFPKRTLVPSLFFKNKRDIKALISIQDHLLREAVSVTEKILKPAMNVSVFKSSNSVRYKNFRQLTRNDLALRQSAEDKIPGLPRVPFSSLDEFQNKGTDQLKMELEQTPEFGLFDNNWEFRNWVDQVANVTDAGRIESKLRDFNARIAELDKKLAPVVNQAGNRYYEEKQRLRMMVVQLRKKKKSASLRPRSGEISPLIKLVPEKPQLSGFDLAMGDDCHLCESDAKALQQISNEVGSMVARFDTFGTRSQQVAFDNKREKQVKDMVKAILYCDNSEQAIGTVDQILQIEDAGVRKTLIRTISQLDSATASKLLACYAKYDVEEEVRFAAIDALRSFPPKMVRAELLAGLRYPWPEVAKHSAEAIVRLNDTESIPALVNLLKRPDPRMPSKQEDGVFVHREMVAINHLRNCMLCHLDSHDDEDKGRGLIPYWDRELPRHYYDSNQPELARVRADVTYLRQDFSVLQKVEDHGLWPENQRFDYVVRKKTVSQAEATNIKRKLASQPNEYKTAIVTALRMLTGKSPRSDSFRAWSSAIKKDSNGKL